MTWLLIDLPILNPIALQLGPIAIRWYAIMYAIGFLIAYFMIKKSKIFSTAVTGDYIFAIALGVILGGRIGYILFYNLAYYIANPLKILALWEGGMSFHGGFLGFIVATWIFLYRHKLLHVAWQLLDTVSSFAPITLALGRIGNFINGELYGRITNLPCAIKFPGAEGYRHPAQLYEATLHIVAYITLFLINKKYPMPKGIMSASFLLAYSIIRITVEFFREPDPQIGFIFHYFTLGQILTIPIFLASLGIFIFQSSRRRPQA